MPRLLASIAASVALAYPASATVWIVDPSGGGDFLDIQSAVDAAVDGDTILVLDGTYTPVIVDGKGLTIQAVGNGVQIQGSLQILNAQPAQSGVVEGIETAGLAGSSVPIPEGVGLWVDNCSGSITVRNCEFKGAKGWNGGSTFTNGKDGLSGVLVNNSSNLALIACTVVGGAGGDVKYPAWNPAGGDGGHGIEAVDSSLALCEVLATGGNGGEAGNLPGIGGDGLHARKTLTAVQSVNGTYTGGTGGIAWDFVAGKGGDGGDAIHAHDEANVKSFGDALFRGPGGLCLVSCPKGKPGKQVNTYGGGTGVGGNGVVKMLGPYCTAGVSASGCTAAIGSSGTPSASAPSGFFLLATGVEGQKQGQFFFSTNGKAMNAWGNTKSFNCVAAPVHRGALLAGNGAIGACDAAFGYDLNAHWTQKPAHNPGAGSLVQAQLWYRDPLSTSNQDSALSDAIEFPVCP